MFEHLRLLQPTERSIVLQTHKGREIRNLIDSEPEDCHRQKYQLLLRRNPNWVERKPMAGGYNCVGHVLAARRTGVFDDLEDQLKVIFDDDGYRLLRENESPRVGDLATYWMPSNPRDTFLHVALIVEMKDGVTKASPRIPWVLSKMDSTSGEVLHHFNQVTFIEGVEHVVRYWTDRP